MRKRLPPLLLTALLVSLSFGCNLSAGAVDRAEVSGSLEEIMQRVYDGSGLELPMLVNTALTEENQAYFLGSSQTPLSEGLASEAAISAIPHSVCLIRVPEGTDVSAVENQLIENARPEKWICVSVEEEDVIVDSIGRLVILIMAEDAEKLHESFLALRD